MNDVRRVGSKKPTTGSGMTPKLHDASDVTPYARADRYVRELDAARARAARPPRP